MRTLARALARCGRSNGETEKLFAYHRATKHTFQSVRLDAHVLDWRNQPNPFRTYDGAPLANLPAEPGFPEGADSAGTFATIAGLDPAASATEQSRCGPSATSGPSELPAAFLDALWISRLLWHSVAISAWKEVPTTRARYSLRVNPSSGNLHPTETYVAVQSFQGIDAGLYHYRADRHALELRYSGAWIAQLAEALASPWIADSPLIVALTSIFWREAWKYRDRAYRYCCHDLGHAMMSVLLAAKALGLSGEVIAHFSDVRLTHMLGLTGSDEAPMVLLVFRPQASAASSPSAASPSFAMASNEASEPPPSSCVPAQGNPNELSPEETRYDLLLDMHGSTILPDPPGPLPRRSQSDLSPELGLSATSGALAPPAPARDSFLASVVRHRRSALDFDERTPPMELPDLEQLLDFATRDWRSDWRGNLRGDPRRNQRDDARGTDFLSLYVYSHRVRGHEPGVYRWHPRPRSLEALHYGNVQRVAAYLSLEQALAGNACFALSMTADLATAARIFGNRGYRYVYFEAGAIGQRLYLGATALGWSATGIGAFYDDDVHRYLGFLPEMEPSAGSSGDAPSAAATLPQQVIYHFAVGRAVPDPRLAPRTETQV